MATSHITDFIQSLNQEELKFVKKNLPSKNKTTQLFSILTEKPEKHFTNKELADLMSVSSQYIRVLKSKLFIIIKDYLLIDEHLENKILFNEKEVATFKLRKQIILVKSSFRRANNKRLETIKVLLNDTISNAKSYEIFDLVVEGLILKKAIIGSRYGVEEYNEINKEIKFYEGCYAAVNSAFDSFYLLVLNQSFISSLSSKQLEQHIYSSIKQLKINYEKTKAQEVNYFMYFLEIALFEHKNNYKQAIIYCKHLLSLVKKSKVLYTPDRIGFIMGNMSLFNVHLENYTEAAKNAQKSQIYHIEHSFNSIVLREQEFYAHFYGKNYRDAQKCNEKLLSHPISDIGEFRNAKFVYYQTCLLFVKKQFKEALQILNKPLEIEKDKARWNISVRVLNILIFIGLNKVNEAKIAIEALRKHIERLSKLKKVERRDLLITNLLRELQKDDFKLNNKNSKAIKFLKELSQKNKPTSWNHFTPELIPFHEWVMTLPSK